MAVLNNQMGNTYTCSYIQRNEREYVQMMDFPRLWIQTKIRWTRNVDGIQETIKRRIFGIRFHDEMKIVLR